MLEPGDLDERQAHRHVETGEQQHDGQQRRLLGPGPDVMFEKLRRGSENTVDEVGDALDQRL